MSGRPKRTGKDRLVSTSAHISVAYLDRIDELGEPQSRFIRQAVGEKLEREEGFLAAIQLQKDDIDRLELELEGAKNNMASLVLKQESWKYERDISDLRNIVMAEYLTGSHPTEAKLLEAIKPMIDTELDIKQVVHEVWIDIKGEGKND